MNMAGGWSSQLEIVLGALYLPGAPRAHEVPRSQWRAVCGALRRSAASLSSAHVCLRAAGLWSEALALQTPGLLVWSEHLVNQGRVLTAASSQFPKNWLASSFAFPPAFYLQGVMPESALIGVVGSRRIGPAARDFARQVGRAAADLGYAIVSGGAAGCDRSGMAGAFVGVEILPCGIEAYEGPSAKEGVCRLSAVAPKEAFTSAAAMERNALIYSASEATVVVQARLRAGGTWAGAADALRRKLTRVLVRTADEPAMRALISLGGLPLSSPEGLQNVLALPGEQPALFRLAASV